MAATTITPEFLRQGIVRVCCHCKKINTASGKWQPEKECTIPPGTSFSHGLCLECCEKLYGRFACPSSHLPSRPNR